MLNIEDRINNVIDELNRATTRLRELGEFSEDTITSDSELVADMETSIERMAEIWDIVGLALIIAGNVGAKSKELFDKNIEFDSPEIRLKCVEWALDILPQCQENNWEDYYDTAWRKTDEEIEKLMKESAT